MSAEDTNNTVFIQRLFTSRDNFTQGNVQEATSNALAFVGQQGRVWWEPTTNRFYYSDGSTPGGIPIGSGGGGGGSSISNGTSNINIAINGNVTTVVAGTTRLSVNNGGANITGTLSVSANANVGNIGATNGAFTTVEGSLTTNSQPNITSVGTLSSLSVSGISNLGAIGNVKITGGSNGQSIFTDGLGNLSFANTAITPAPMPTYVATGDTLTISANYQGLFGYPITVDGTIVVDGVLVDVNDATVPAGSLTYVQYNDGNVMGGSAAFTFVASTGLLSVPNITTTGVVKTIAGTYSSLPIAATAGAGSRSFITDADTTTFLATVGGGGSNAVPVVSNGTVWIVG